MKKSAEQRRKKAKKKQGAKASEESKNIALPIPAPITATQDSYENKADNHTESKAVQKNQDNGFTGKTIRMSIFLSAITLTICGVLGSIAIANWQKGNVWPALWWGIATYVLFGVGAFFTYYYSVIKPTQEVAKEAPQATPEAIIAIDADMLRLSANLPVEIRLKFRNFGNIPATLTGEWKIVISKNQVIVPDFTGGRPFRDLSVLHNDEKGRETIIISSFTLTKEEEEKIISDTYHLFLLVRGSQSDKTGTKSFTSTMCYVGSRHLFADCVKGKQ